MELELARQELRDMRAGIDPRIVAFGKALDTAYGGHWDDWAYFLEKPDHWASEFVAWVNNDSPQEGDDGWDSWLDYLFANV